jgi:uroporphyrinogen-III synthase
MLARRTSGSACLRILITRPREDGEEIAARLAEMGHQAMLAPLLTPRFTVGPEPELDDVEAILATSANGIRALSRRTARRDLAIFAVGQQTAEEALRNGFSQVKNADGDARALAESAALWASRTGVLLHVCGEDAPGTLAENLEQRGFRVRRCVLYAIEAATQLPPEVAHALKDGALDAAMFFSPRSARVFADLTEGLPTRTLTALCISPATAQVLDPDAFARVRVAERPNQAAMLTLVA